MDNPPSIKLGSRVLISDTTTQAQRTYQIVPASQASADKGYINISTPIAQALLGKRHGELVTVFTPGGKREFRIVDYF